MARQTDATPPAVPAFQLCEKMRTERREYHVITPMLGGGAKVQHPDAQTTVRVSQIRGLLRYWWRATRGSQYETIGDLKKAEANIWGGQIDKNMLPSKVVLRLLEVEGGTRIQKDNDISASLGMNAVSDVASQFSYVLWPLRPQNSVPVNFDLRKDIKFTISITYPVHLQSEVEAALWAWETFGGIGGRTRRGLGALCLASIDGAPIPLPASGDVSHAILSAYRKHVVQGNSQLMIPQLTGMSSVGGYSPTGASVAVTETVSTSADQWHMLVQRYRKYRQERYMRSVNGTPKQYGSSVWPDANAIRAAFRVAPHTQSPYNIEPHVARAQMGLPIIMSFMPEKFEARNRNRTTFMLDNTEGRHASPLLFRPLLTAKGAVGLIIILAKSRIDYPVRLSTNERYTPHEQTISPRGSHDVRNHGNDRNLDPKPHGPTNTADVLAGVFAYMQQ